jgi:two-component system sensor histidine kinase CreC
VHALTHEMKSPLAAIRASAELLEQPLPEADQARFSAAIRVQSERLASMIDRLLALAAVEHRQRIDDPQRIDVRALLRDVAADSEARLGRRRQRLVVHANVDAGIDGDPFLLRQALDNLVDNASDFAPLDGTIELGVERDGDDLVIEVRDRGPGVPDFARERVFDRFYSLPRPDGGHRGSGLGLCFVDQVADLHGGAATLANRDGGGAVATLRLPTSRGA